MITQTEIREGFNQLIAAASAEGNWDAVAKFEVAREFFADDEFRLVIQDYVWALSSAKR